MSLNRRQGSLGRKPREWEWAKVGRASKGKEVRA